MVKVKVAMLGLIIILDKKAVTVKLFEKAVTTAW